MGWHDNFKLSGTPDTKRICIYQYLPLFTIGLQLNTHEKEWVGQETRGSLSVVQACRWWRTLPLGDRHKIHQCPRTSVIGHKSCHRQGWARNLPKPGSRQSFCWNCWNSDRKYTVSALHWCWIKPISWGGAGLDSWSTDPPVVQGRDWLSFIGRRGRDAEKASLLKLRCTRSVKDRGCSRRIKKTPLTPPCIGVEQEL